MARLLLKEKKFKSNLLSLEFHSRPFGTVWKVLLLLKYIYIVLRHLVKNLKENGEKSLN